MTQRTWRIISPLAAYASAILTTLINPALWPLAIAIATLATINLRNATRKDTLE